MTPQQIFYIIFSILLLPINVASAFWLVREAVNLTGMTFTEFVDQINERLFGITDGSHRFSRGRRMRRVRRAIAEFYRENSSDPKKSNRLTWTFGICTLPSLIALNLAGYSAMFPNKLEYAAVGDCLLVVLNLGFVLWGRSYRKQHPLDARIAEQLQMKRKQSKRNPVKNILVYGLVGILFFGFLLFFMMGMARTSSGSHYQSSQKSAIEIQADLISILNEKGYETANVPTTYWELDEEKLEHVAAGTKGDSKFEFYGYSDKETVDLVYNQIIYITAPELEHSEREAHETSLSGGKMFTIQIDGVYYLVLYQKDTVIYAYSPDSLDEMNGILEKIGYSKE